MRRQELGSRKRQKRTRDEDEDSILSSGSPASGGDSQSEEPSVLDEGEGGRDSAPETSVQGAKEDIIPSRFSFKRRKDTATGKAEAPPHVSLLSQTFAGMGVSLSLISAMNKMSIHTPTEIQAACIPPLLNGTCFSYSTSWY